MSGAASSDAPLPSRAKLEAALQRMDAGDATTEDWSEIEEGAQFALHVLPPEADFVNILTRNPLTQVYFRAGLLACRETMARFVEQGGHPEIAQSIRANWWPSLGDDPGPPRLFDFDEVAEETEVDGKYAVRSKEISASVEALPRAAQFLQVHGGRGRG